MECLLICLGHISYTAYGFVQLWENLNNGAVLVAISIPIFTGQLNKAREATDAANIRLHMQRLQQLEK